MPVELENKTSWRSKLSAVPTADNENAGANPGTTTEFPSRSTAVNVHTTDEPATTEVAEHAVVVLVVDNSVWITSMFMALPIWTGMLPSSNEILEVMLDASAGVWNSTIHSAEVAEPGERGYILKGR